MRRIQAQQRGKTARTGNVRVARVAGVYVAPGARRWRPRPALARGGGGAQPPGDCWVWAGNRGRQTGHGTTERLHLAC